MLSVLRYFNAGLLLLAVLTAGYGQDVTSQTDVVDVAGRLFPHWRTIQRDSVMQTPASLWVVPLIGYSPQTGFLGSGSLNAAYRKPAANLSTITASIIYTQNHQLLLTSMNSLWSRNNTLLLQSDYRVMRYPQSTFGLGMFTNPDNPIQMDYEYLRLYQNVLRRLFRNLYAGFGYALDLHWNIVARNNRREFTRISRYPFGVEGRSISSGPTLNLLYDSRANSLNPGAGTYANLVLRTNPRWLGSTTRSTMLLLDWRRYWQSGGPLGNVLALWSYNSLVLDGNAPFLDLPSTGWDTYSNTGRGHVQGRFRGQQFLYLETEYRFALTRSRLLGGVVFANAQTVSEYNRRPIFQRVAPAAGAGLRLRLNKFTRANLGVDYGMGFDGAHGLYFTFGEVF